MKLHCPDCGTRIAADDVNLSTYVARCRACDSVFSFGSSLRDFESGSHRRPAVGRAAKVDPRREEMLVPPEGMVVQDTGRLWSARWRWFRPEFIGLAVFCVAWDAFLTFWYSAALGPHKPGDGSNWLMVVFPVGHVAIGVGMTYYTLCGFLNRTTLLVTQYEVIVRHRPLPWLGNRRLVAAEITQLYCGRAQSRSNNAGPSWTYTLMACLNEGRQVKLVGGFRELGEAQFLERTLEDRLNLAPRPVVGEYRDGV